MSLCRHSLARPCNAGRIITHSRCLIKRCMRCRVVCSSQSQTVEAADTPTTCPTWASYVSRRINLELAVEEAIEGACRGHPEHWQPELAVVFLSSAYVQEYPQLISQLRNRIPSLKYIFGSTGYGVIGSTQEGPEEIEHAPALSLTLASLPGTHISIQHITKQQLPDGDAPPEQWAQLLGVELHSEHPTNFIILAEPEWPNLTELTAGLDFAFPAANKIGGLVSAGKLSPTRSMFAWTHSAQQQEQTQQEQQQQQQPLEQQSQEQPEQQPGTQQQQQQQRPLLRTGAVVLSLQGPVDMELLVAQGCRPLSSSIYTIDGVADGGPVVVSLRDKAGRKLTPLEALQRELHEVASSRSELMVLLQNMALGLMPDVLRASDGPQPEPHDFLIRGMALSKAGFMVVGDAVRVGQRVRFMVRDRAGAQQDLTSHCLAYKRRELAATLGGSGSSSSSSGRPMGSAFGMLLFSCNGRGMNLYDEPSWDSRTLAGYIPVPCGGFMCNGELGSIGGTTHLHGFTCAAAVLRAVLPAAADKGVDAESSSSSGSSPPEGSSRCGRLDQGEAA